MQKNYSKRCKNLGIFVIISNIITLFKYTYQKNERNKAKTLEKG